MYLLKIIVYTEDANEVYSRNGDIFQYRKSNSNLIIWLFYLHYYLKKKKDKYNILNISIYGGYI